MALYSYIKKLDTDKKSRIKKRSKKGKVFSLGLIIVGILLLSGTVGPILFFELFYSPNISSVAPPVNAQTAQFDLTEKDYTKASAWFPKALSYKLSTDVGNEYTLSIPSVGIDHAKVVIGGENLAESLVQFTGPTPGNKGSPVIFGHSTLPILYNPLNYRTIFTKLPSLKKGDVITLFSDAVNYTYEVTDLKIITPDDLSVLSQDTSEATLKLVTCVPPGLTTKRLVVKAKLTS